MRNRILAALLILAGLLTMQGCWDYRGMDEIDIVAGLAIDKGEQDGYEVTLEIVNIASMNSGKGDSPQSIFVTASGPTLFEAVRNSKKSLYNVLYFGSMRTLVIGKEAAQTEGLYGILDYLLRYVESRETISLIISQEESAKALITTTGMDTSKVSYEMARILEENEKIGPASVQVLMYQAYNMLKAPGKSLVLPVFHVVQNNEKDAVEVNGIAVFNGDKLSAFLTPEETHYFVLASKNIKGGAISFPLEDNGGKPVSLEIHNSKCSPDVIFDGESITIKNTIELKLGVVDLENVNKTIDDDTLQKIAREAEKAVEHKVRQVFVKTQAIGGGDIYGYGNHIYKNQLELWRQIESSWDELYSRASLQLVVKVVIVNSGFIT